MYILHGRKGLNGEKKNGVLKRVISLATGSFFNP